MSESMDRSLGLSEWLQLRLHLTVCAWCARYLQQIKFLRQLLREKNNAEGVRYSQPRVRSEAKNPGYELKNALKP